MFTHPDSLLLVESIDANTLHRWCGEHKRQLFAFAWANGFNAGELTPAQFISGNGVHEDVVPINLLDSLLVGVFDRRLVEEGIARRALPGPHGLNHSRVGAGLFFELACLR